MFIFNFITYKNKNFQMPSDDMKITMVQEHDMSTFVQFYHQRLKYSILYTGNTCTKFLLNKVVYIPNYLCTKF